MDDDRRSMQELEAENSRLKEKLAELERTVAQAAPDESCTVADHARAAELLAEQHAQFQAMFDGMDEAAYVTDPETYELLFLNRAARSTWGDRLGEKCHVVLQGLDAPCPFCTNNDIFGRNLGTTHIWEFQNTVNKRWYRCIDRAIRWHDERMVRFELAIDVTGVKQLEVSLRDKGRELAVANEELTTLNEQLAANEEELLAQNDELEAAVKVKDEFLSMVSHELRTPLVPILGYSELMLDGSFGALPEGARKALYAINSRGAALTRLIDDLLMLSRADRKTLRFAIAPLALRKHLLETVHDYRTMEHGKQVQLHWNGKGFNIFADHERLHQALNNLIDNAIKYSEGPSEITVVTRSEERFGIIEVHDRGIGIPAEHLPHIFDRFYQVEEVNTRTRQGSGLGLAIVKELVESMNGEIWVRSRQGRGSVFGLKFPLAGNEETGTGTEPVSDPDADDLVETRLRRVLVVEDDADTLELIESLLEDRCQALTASSGDQGLELIRRARIDLVLLDWMMPGLDGLELLRSIRADSSLNQIPVVVVSGKVEARFIAQAMDAGADAFVTKPFKKEELFAGMAAALAKRC